ncbi:MAG: DUF1565 domain-containing protein [Moorea sp. SIO4G3]|nr:DUF1565 domain-containing protein [Moorena sp. SIO4G3]
METMGTLYVNPTTGDDSATGSESAPLKTITGITGAISKVQVGDTIQLAPGTYNRASGEKFPLKVPSGIKIVGNDTNKGKDILIEGGGDFVSPSSALQNISISLANNTELRGVTVTNTEPRGTGVWLESTSPIIANCTFTKCNREGIQATGTAAPQILNNLFIANLGQGIAYRKTSAGEARGNICQDMAAGIDIGNEANPLIISNTISGNRFGMTIFSDAKPILRSNEIKNSTDDGISVSDRALPDLGTDSEKGKNIFRNNGKYHINNSSSNQLLSTGNSFTCANKTELAQKIKGDVDLKDSTIIGKHPVDFPDLNDHWAEDFIYALLAEQILSGYPDGTLKPNDNITRAQYAALLVKAFNPQPKRAQKTFKDVDTDYWAAEVIQQAYRGEFLSGYPNDNFKPNDPIKRADVIVSVINGLGLSDTKNNALSFYNDRTTIPTYAVDAVKTATMKKIVVNYPNVKRLRPTEGTTRAELAAMVYQALLAQGKLAAISSPYIVVYTQDSSDSSFSDAAGHWAEKFIEGLCQGELITGYPDGTFKPDAQMTRAQYAALLNQVFTLTPKREAIKFSDVSNDFWAEEVIQKAYRAGFLSGFPDGTFKPNDHIQRVQVLVSLVNGLGLSASENVVPYSDHGSIPDYGKDQVNTATAKGLVVNYPDVEKLQPTEAATRGEVSALIYQTLVNAGELAAIDSNYVVKVDAQYNSLEQLRKTKECQNCNLAGVELSGEDLEGAKLAGANLKNANLPGVNLKSADLENANFARVNLESANLESANLKSANLESANLSKAKLESANLKSANLSKANLESANLSLFRSRKATNLEGANLTEANLSKAYIVNINLSGVNLERANLQQAQLSSLYISASLPIYQALITSKLKEANLAGANLEDTDLGGIDLSYANLSNASLKGARLEYTFDGTYWGLPNEVYRANLEGANLTNTIMPDGSTHK